jgi:penicillin-binding protein 1A
MRAGPGDTRVILEAFKPGTAPPDSYSVIGSTADQQQPDSGYVSPTPEADRAVRSGNRIY